MLSSTHNGCKYARWAHNPFCQRNFLHLQLRLGHKVRPSGTWMIESELSQYERQTWLDWVRVSALVSKQWVCSMAYHLLPCPTEVSPHKLLPPKYGFLRCPSQELLHAKQNTTYKHCNKMKKHFCRTIFFVNPVLHQEWLSRIATDNHKDIIWFSKIPCNWDKVDVPSQGIGSSFCWKGILVYDVFFVQKIPLRVWSNKRSIFFCIVRTKECSFSWTYPRG
jgi:hypothetical protein